MKTNYYRVQKHTWKKWTPEGRQLFNEIYKVFRVQNNVNHPEATKIPQAHWETLRWNAAWLAASLISKMYKAADFERVKRV